jgi:hypothetical protein
MSLGGPGPISGEAARIGLTHDQIVEAEAHEAAVSRAALDEEELRELEHAEYYPDEPALAPPRPRSFLDRLLRRR